MIWTKGQRAKANTKKGALTTRGVAALQPGKWAADPAARGAGRLQVIKLNAGGLAWYFRYTRSDGKRDALPLGTDLTLAEARGLAAQLSRRYQAGERDLRDALEAEQRAIERSRQDADAVTAVQKKLAAATLGVLLRLLRSARSPWQGKCLRRPKGACKARREAVARALVETGLPSGHGRPTPSGREASS